MSRWIVAGFLLLTSMVRADVPTTPTTFNYRDNDPADYQRTKSAFVAEYDKVVAYLNRDQPGSTYGYTDILNLWDYRESLRKQAGQSSPDPDDLYALARRVKTNLSRQVSDLEREITDHETEYQIRFLLLVAQKFADSKVWNPVTTHDRALASRELHDVVNALTRSGKSVELAEQEFQQNRNTFKSIEQQEREKALREALRLVAFRETRSKQLIAARKEMYEKGFLPENPRPDGPPFMDLACCKYWVQYDDGKPHVTGYYINRQGERVNYTSEALEGASALAPQAGLFALASGNGYHIYQADVPSNPLQGTTYVVVQLGDSVKELHRLRVVKWLNTTPPADYSFYKINYQESPDGEMKSLVLK